MRISELLDGKFHYLEPGEDFAWPVDQEVIDWEELDEDEPLAWYETPACAPVLKTDRRKTSAVSKWPEEAQIKAHISQGWSAFAVAMGAVMHCIKGEKVQYAYPKYDGTPDQFSFQIKPVEGGWQGGVL